MLRRAVVLAAAVALSACGGDSSGPPALTADDVTGVWDLFATGCLNGTLPVRLAASSDGALSSGVNTWTNDEDLGFFRPLDGVVQLDDGGAEFHMWADADHEAAIIFIGSLRSDGSLSGTLTDPMPGYGPIFHFSGGPTCIAQVSGNRR